MNTPKPPQWAVWLLERFAKGKNREALLGDLLERFQDQRQSVMWFWRQTLLALLMDLFNKLFVPWSVLGFSALWSGLLCSVYGSIWRCPPVESLHHWQVGLDWPWSLVYELWFIAVLDSLLLLSGLIVYFGLSHLPVVRCVRAIGAAFPLLIFGHLQLMLMSFAHRPVFVWYLATGFGFFTSLLLSLWVAQPRSKRYDVEGISDLSVT